MAACFALLVMTLIAIAFAHRHALVPARAAAGWAAMGLVVCLGAGCAAAPPGENARQDAQAPQTEDRGLLPVIGYQRPLLPTTSTEPYVRDKVLFLMPASALAPLDASRPVNPGGCTVLAEVAGAGTDHVVVNLRLQWTPGPVEWPPCKYDPGTAKEAYVLVKDIPPSGTILTDGPVADVRRDEIAPANALNAVPQMPEARPPGG